MYKYIKRVLDIISSIIGLTLLAPVFLVIAGAIKVNSKGPVFFIHKRLGKDGKIFRIIKFRTMVVGAEKMGTGLAIKSAKDSRITKTGAFLRATSLDELPQLINILKGEMSFVGPRPPAVYYPYNSFKKYPEWAKKRFEIRPGLTGLSQVVYRNNASWNERIKLDVQYVEDIKIVKDLAIVLKTALRVFKRENVYRDSIVNSEREMKMKQINILITAAGGPSALGVIKCLKEIDSIRLIGTDCQNQTAGDIFCDKVYYIPRISNIEEYKKAIIEIIDQENIDVIYPTLHDEIIIYHEFRKQIQVKVALPISNTFKMLIDKGKLYQYLATQEMNKYVPQYYIFQDNHELKQIINEVFSGEQRVCVKGVQGCGGIGFAELLDRKNYLQALKAGKSKIYNIDDYYDIDFTGRRMVMEYLDGSEYSVDIFIHDGEVIVAVPRKRNRVSNCVVIDGMVEFNKEIIEAASEIAKAIITNGFINLQFIGSSRGYKLTDVNARFCGSQEMSFGAGVNFPYLYIQYNLLNEHISVSPKWNTRMIRYWESYFFCDL